MEDNQLCIKLVSQQPFLEYIFYGSNVHDNYFLETDEILAREPTE